MIIYTIFQGIFDPIETRMKKETKKALKLLGLASSIGFTVAFSIFIGVAIGVWLDREFDTWPWLTILFTIFGIIAGFRNYFRYMKKQERDQKEQD